MFKQAISAIICSVSLICIHSIDANAQSPLSSADASYLAALNLHGSFFREVRSERGVDNGGGIPGEALSSPEGVALMNRLWDKSECTGHDGLRLQVAPKKDFNCNMLSGFLTVRVIYAAFAATYTDVTAFEQAYQQNALQGSGERPIWKNFANWVFEPTCRMNGDTETRAINASTLSQLPVPGKSSAFWNNMSLGVSSLPFPFASSIMPRLLNLHQLGRDHDTLATLKSGLDLAYTDACNAYVASHNAE